MGAKKELLGSGAFVAAVMLTLIMSIIISIIRPFVQDDFAMMVIKNVIHLLYFAAIALGILLISKKASVPIECIGKKPGGVSLCMAIVCLVLTLVGFYLLGTLFGYFLTYIGYHAPGLSFSSPTEWVFVIIRVTIFAPIAEELLFRGALLGGLRSMFAKKRGGDLIAVLLSGTAFMLLHMNPAQTAYQLFFGFMLAMLTLSCGSIIPAMLAHSLNNTVALVLEVAAGSSPAAGLREFFAAMPALFVVIAIVLAVAALPSMYLLCKRLKKRDPPLSLPDRSASGIASTKMPAVLFAAAAIMCAGVWIVTLLSGLGGA